MNYRRPIGEARGKVVIMPVDFKGQVTHIQAAVGNMVVAVLPTTLFRKISTPVAFDLRF